MHDDDPRDERGVRRRVDGGGDSFGNAHRARLGNWAYMQDLDALFGFEAFAKNTSDLLFAEYEPDPFHNSQNIIRRFGLVAMFDRKSTFEVTVKAIEKERPVLTAFYLYQCRLNAAVQPIPPRFFFCSDIKLPSCPNGWGLFEVNINTGQRVGDCIPITADNMNSVWDEIGLREAHAELARWLDRP